MGAPDSPQSVLVVASLLGLAVSCAVYLPAIRGLRREGGQVKAGVFGLPELLMAFVLAGFFVALVSMKPPDSAPMTVRTVLGSAFTFAAIVAVVLGFLVFRRISLREAFGLTTVAPHRVVGRAILFLIGAFPLIALVTAATQHFISDKTSEQELVQLFRSAAEGGNLDMMRAVCVTGVIVAPVGEEFLFRGFFYGVGKRYAGPWIGGVLTSILFAVLHRNLGSLPALIVLAILLNVAYERTGSLAVPITMHALFNGSSLAILYLQATGHVAV